jgi:hypothetical protein
LGVTKEIPSSQVFDFSFVEKTLSQTSMSYRHTVTF